MNGFKISRLASADADSLLAYSRRRFGLDAADAYEALIIRAFAILRADPANKSVKPSDDGRSLYRFHLRSVPQGTPRAVSRPRHWIIFQTAPEQVTIVRILHEKMDMKRHIR